MVIAEQLTSLKNNLDGSLSSPKLCIEIVECLRASLLGMVDHAEIDQSVCLMFHEHDGLCNALKSAITKKQYEKFKVESFRLLTIIVSKKEWKEFVTPHCYYVKNICNIFWQNSKESSKVQSASLECMIEMLNNIKEKIDPVLFGLSELFETLLPSTEKTSFQPTVRGKMFELLGMIAFICGKEFQPARILRLCNHMLKCIRNQVESLDAKFEVTITQGCLQGISFLLDGFNDPIDALFGCEDWLRFCDNILQIIDPGCSIESKSQKKDIKIKRRQFQRVALTIVGSHSVLFETHFWKCPKRWFQDLLSWTRSNNVDDTRAGFKSIFAFLKQISMTENKTEDEDEATAVFLAKKSELSEYLLNQFLSLLKKNVISKNEKLVAVKGFGLILPAGNGSRDSERVLLRYFSHIDSVIAELNAPVLDKYGGSLTLINTYVETMANVLDNLSQYMIRWTQSEYTRNQKRALELSQEAVSLIASFFPDMLEKYRFYCHNVVSKVFNSVFHHHSNEFQFFTETFVANNLSNMISLPTKEQINLSLTLLPENAESKTMSSIQKNLKGIEAYCSFWSSLFSNPDSTVKTVHSTTMEWIISAIIKLDLSINYGEDNDDVNSEDYIIEVCSADPLFNARASKQQDVHIFCNIVDFINGITKTRVNQELFTEWLDQFISLAMKLSDDFPYISGFFKILEISFKVARNTNYFEEKEKSERKQQLLNDCCAFLQRCSGRLPDLRNELLISVLQMWLSLPTNLLLRNISALENAFEMVFVIGKYNYPLAEEGISVLQNLMDLDSFPESVSESIFRKLFPIWKTYFISAGNESLIFENKRFEKLTPSKLKLIRKHKAKLLEDSSLKTVQLKLLSFFGNYIHLVDCFQSEMHEDMLMDHDILMYSVPFVDIKPDIALDNVFPRLSKLCLSSVDVQLRIAACEFFHSYVIYFLGKSLQIAGLPTSQNVFSKILRMVYTLGSDPDIFIRQLFNPLGIQIMHWASDPNNPFQDCILTTLIDSLVDQSQGYIKDYCTLCLSELFSWNIRHITKQKKLAKDILNSIYVMSTHASYNYRLGASLAFNSIYKMFRENNEFVNEYTLILMYSFCLGLKLNSEKDVKEHIFSIKCTKESISHLEKIIIKKKDSFNVPIFNRKTPPEIQKAGKEIFVLSDLVSWLLSSATDESTLYRSSVLKLAGNLLAFTKDKKGLLAYFDQPCEENSMKLIFCAEVKLGQIDPNSPRSSLSKLCAALDIYRFYDSKSVNVKELLCHPSSKLLVTAGELFPKIELQINDETTAFITLNCCSKFSNLIPLTPPSLARLILVSSLKFAMKYGATDCSRELEHLWSHSLSVDSTTKMEMDGLVNSIFDGIYREWGLKKRITNLTSCFKTLLKAEYFKDAHQTHVANLAEGIRNLIEKSLYCFDENGRLITTGNLSSHIVEGLLDLTSIYISLQQDRSKIIELVFDQTLLANQEFKTTKGDHFQKFCCVRLFEFQEIFSFSNLRYKIPMEKLSQFIYKMLLVIPNLKSNKSSYADLIITETFRIFKFLQLNCSVDQMTKIIHTIANYSFDLCQNSEEILHWWENLMTSSNLGIKEKANLLHFVVLFMSSHRDEIHRSVKKALDSLLSSLKTATWEEDGVYVVKAASKLLVGWQKNTERWYTLEVFMQLVSFIEMNEPDNTFCRKECPVMLKRINRRLSKNLQTKLLLNTFDALLTLIKESKTAYGTFKFIFIPVILSSHFESSQEFYKQKIWDIIQIAEMNAESKMEFLHKTLSFNLIELMPLTTGVEFIQSDELFTEYKLRCLKKDPSLKEFVPVLRVFVKACISFKKQVRPSQICDETRRANLSCNQAAYNAMGTIIKATKKEERFFTTFLFDYENHPDDCMWERLVDVSSKYDFSVTLEDSKGNNEKLLDKMKKNTLEDPYDGFQQQNVEAKKLLAGSSLAPHATNYDFTNAVDINESDFYKRIFDDNSLSNAGDINEPCDVDGVVSGSDEYIEDNEINRHECMFNFVQMLKTVHKFYLQDPNNSSYTLLNKKNWCFCLLRPLQDPMVHENVKIFLIGAILNFPDVITPLCQNFLNTILRVTLNFSFKRKLNFFTKDIIINLLSFSSKCVPETELVAECVNLFFENSYMDSIVEEKKETTDANTAGIFRKDIFENNMEILQEILLNWVKKPSCELPLPMLKEKLSNVDSCWHALELYKCILKAKFFPFEESELKSWIIEFFKMMKMEKKIGLAAGHIVGLIIRLLLEKGRNEFKQCHKYCVKRIETLSQNRDVNVGPILISILESFPLFLLDPFDQLFALSNVLFEEIGSGKNAYIALNSVYVTIMEYLEDENQQRKIVVCKEFVMRIKGTSFVSKPLVQADEIEIAIKLLTVIVDYLELQELYFLLDWVSGAATSHINHIRVAYAKLLLKMVGKKKGDRDLKSWFKIFMDLSNDDCPEVQEVLEKFWALTLTTWQDSSKVILELLSLTAGMEQCSINFIIALLGKRCSSSPDFEKYVFDKPLENSNFVKFVPATSWRYKTATLGRLFADRMSSIRAPGNFTPQSLLSQRAGVNLIKATLQFGKFSMTQKNLSYGAESLVQQNISQMLDYEINLSSTKSSKPDTAASSSSASVNLHLFSRLRKRFYGAQSSKDFFLEQNFRDQQRGEQKLEENAKQKREGVKLVREYRVGELPDIMIKHSDIMKSLLNLAKLDDDISKTLFISLFNGFFVELSVSKNSRSFLSDASDVFHRFLKNSVNSMSTSSLKLTAGIFEVCLRHQLTMDYEIVSSAAQNFGFYNLGILLLEDAIIDSDYDAKSSRKKVATSAKQKLKKTDEIWIKIMGLYSECENYDAVRSLYRNLCNSSENSCRDFFQLCEKARRASRFEGLGQYDESFKIYNDLVKLEDKEGIPAFDLWEDAMKKCLLVMSEWGDLYDDSLERYNWNVHEISDCLENPQYIVKILPFQFRAGVNMMLRYNVDELPGSISKYSKQVEDFQNFLEKAYEYEGFYKRLKQNFPSDLSMMWITDESDDASKCRLTLEAAREQMLQQFKMFDSLMQPQKKELMLNIQKMATTEAALQWLDSFRYRNLKGICAASRSILSKWKRFHSNEFVPLTNCDVLTNCRHAFFEKFVTKMKPMASQNREVSELVSNFHALNFRQHLWLISLAIRHENESVVMKYLEASKSFKNEVSNELFLEWRKAFARFLATFQTEDGQGDWLTMWISTWNKIKKIEANTEEKLDIQCDLMRSLLMCLNNHKLEDDPETRDKTHKLVKSLEYCGGQKSILKIAMDFTKNLIDGSVLPLLPALERNNEIFLKLYYLSEFLVEEVDTEDRISSRVFKENMIRFLLKSMEMGCRKAMMLFPKIISLLVADSGNIASGVPFGNIYNDHVGQIPSSLFLPWLDQIVTNYKTHPHLKDIMLVTLSKVANKYPQAFQLQYPDLIDSRFLSEESLLFKKYAKALSSLVMPQAYYKNLIDDLFTSHDKKMMLRKFQCLKQTLLSKAESDTGNSFIYQDYTSKLWIETEGLIENGITVLSSSLDSPISGELDSNSHINDKKIIDIVNEISVRMNHLNNAYDAKVKEQNHIMDLADFSPWLKSFHFSNERHQIEIPGQYHGFNEPRPETHSMIASFHPTVRVMKSLMKPICYSYIGNNGKRYKFLAKFGDDLRQDKRILQIFEVTNHLFKEHSHQNRFHLYTYPVIPLSEDYGIIGWVEDTVELQKFLLSSLQESQRNEFNKHKFEDWITKTSKCKSTVSTEIRYLHSANNVTRKDAENFLARLVDMKCYFRERFIEKSVSFEQFFNLRSSFTKNYAVSCSVGWMLGIGDRHLQNFLMKLDEGAMISVDFGRSFGTGMMPGIPELVPFRLSPQFEKFLQPYGKYGYFKEILQVCLRVLKKEKDFLLAVAEVFINEPAVPWLKLSKGKEKLSTGNERSNLISVIRKKLEGVNPITVMLEELRTFHAEKGSIYATYSKILLHSREHVNNHKYMSEEEIAESLIDLATDKFLLARLFYGWSPWM